MRACSTLPVRSLRSLVTSRQALRFTAARRSRWGCWSGAPRTPARTPAAGGAPPTQALPTWACNTLQVRSLKTVMTLRRSRWGCWSGALRTPARTPAAGGARPPWTPTLPGRACTTPRTPRPSGRRSPAARAAEPPGGRGVCRQDSYQGPHASSSPPLKGASCKGHL